MSNSYEAIFRDSVSILDTYNEDYSPDFQVDEFYRNNRVSYKLLFLASTAQFTTTTT